MWNNMLIIEVYNLQKLLDKLKLALIFTFDDDFMISKGVSISIPKKIEIISKKSKRINYK